MKIEDLSFCIEVTEENTAKVDGGYFDFDYIDSGYYISDIDVYNNYLQNLSGVLSIGANPVQIEPFSWGGAS